MAPPRIDPLIRFTAKYVVQPNGCWLWTGPQTGKSQKWTYGMFRPGGRLQNIHAHRWAYIHYRGDISPGLHLDHLCRNGLCVNPDHLEAVTPKENINRGENFNALKTHCKRGHEFTPENTYWTKAGRRRCRACRAIVG